MKRFLMTLTVVCALSGPVLAGQIPTTDSPAPGEIPTTDSSEPGEIRATGSPMLGEIPSTDFSVVLVLLDLAF
jgi:hypothetical protein